MDKRYFKIDGKEYPCKLSYKAYKEFEARFKPLSQLRETIEDGAKLFFCGLIAACSSDGIEFPMDFEAFENWMDDNLRAFNDFKNFQTVGTQEKGKKLKNVKSPSA